MPIGRSTASYTLNPTHLDCVTGSSTQRPYPRDIHRPSETDIGAIESQMMTALRQDADSIPGTCALAMFEALAKTLDAHNTIALDSLPASSRDIALTLDEIAAHGPEHGITRTAPGTPARALAQDAASFLACREQANGGVALTISERATAMLDFVGRVVRNDFEGDFARWSANVVNAYVRTGIIVGLATIMRQVVGFSVEKALLLGDAQMPAREAIGAAAFIIGPALHIVGFIRDEGRDTATTHSRTARLAMSAMSVASLLAASSIGSSSVLASSIGSSSVLASMGASTVQTLSYTLARDIAQLVFPTTNNADITLPGSLIAGGIYAASQFAAGEGMEAFAPSSGPARVSQAMAQAMQGESADAAGDRLASWFTRSNDSHPAGTQAFDPVQQRVHDAVQALGTDLRQDATRGAINAMGEVADELTYSGLNRAVQVSRLKSATRREALSEGRDPEAAVAALPREDTEGLRLGLRVQMPTVAQAVDQFTTTNAARTTAFQIMTAGSSIASAALAQTNLPPAIQAHLVNAVVASIALVVYLPIVYTHDQTPLAGVNGTPTLTGWRLREPETGLRQRTPRGPGNA